MSFGIGIRARLDRQGPEAAEDLAGHDLESAFGFVRRADASTASRSPWIRANPLRANQPCRVKTQTGQVVLGRFNRLQYGIYEFLDRDDNFAALAAPFLIAAFVLVVAIIPDGILGQRRPQALEHPVVIDNHAAVFARIDAVGAGDGLHQRVGLHRFVDVQRLQALHVEARQPHGAYDGDAERMLRIFERILDPHPLAVRRLETVLHDRRDGE